MDDRALYATILGLERPWRVTQVEVATEAEEVVVHLELEEGSELCCPECGEAAPGYDRASTMVALPNGTDAIVMDRFHVAQHINRAVDRTRRSEHRKLLAERDDRLKKSRYIWIKGSAKRRVSEDLRIQHLLRSGLKVGRAWALKEAALKLWTYRSRTWALKYFRRWYAWAIRSRLPEMIASARMMRNHLPWILNYLRHRHTNALAEGMNAKIQEIKYRARGYRNRDSFRRAILFHCGRLDMNPR